jgi:hypothetical protein
MLLEVIILGCLLALYIFAMFVALDVVFHYAAKTSTWIISKLSRTRAPVFSLVR